MIVKMELAATIDSSLAGTVELAMPYPGSINFASALDYLIGGTQGCQTIPNSGTQHFQLGSLQPHQQSQFMPLWIVIPEAITPTDTSPTERSLAKRGLSSGESAGNINGNPAILKFSGTGQAHLVCHGPFATKEYLELVPTTCSQIEQAERGETG